MTIQQSNDHGTFEAIGMVVTVISMWIAYFVFSALSNSFIEMNQQIIGNNPSLAGSGAMQQMSATMPNILALMQIVTVLATIMMVAMILIQLMGGIGRGSYGDSPTPSRETPMPRASVPTSLPTAPIRSPTPIQERPVHIFTPAPEPAPARNTDNRWETLDVAMETDKDTF